MTFEEKLISWLQRASEDDGSGVMRLLRTSGVIADLGDVSDAAWNGTDANATLIAIAKAIKLGTAVTIADGAAATIGAKSDSAWDGLAASASEISILKKIAALVLSAGENHIGEVGGKLLTVSAEFTRPNDTTAYAINDTVSNSTSSPSVLTFTNIARSSGLGGYLVKARLMTDQSTNTAQHRLHLFHTAPSAINDNSPYTLLWANRANRIGHIDFPAMNTEGTGSNSANARDIDTRMAFVTSGSRNLYGILTAKSIYTPAALQNYFIELSADCN